jgi:hypothetical protein
VEIETDAGEDSPSPEASTFNDVAEQPSSASPDSGVRPRGRLGAGFLQLGAHIAHAQRGWRWLPLAFVAGVLPLLACWPLGSSAHQTLSGLALTVLIWGALHSGRAAVGITTILVAFGAHSAFAISLAASTTPDQLVGLFPDGPAYWDRQEAWIRSGHDPEYELANWLPAHFQLLGACFVLAPLTLGLAIFARGFYEVDLMNVYVGTLLRESGGAWGALLVGWHPWSICRGLCYALLTYELVGRVGEWLTGRSPPPGRARTWRVVLAFVFFAADCVIKSSCMEAVQGVLYASLVR